MASSEESSPETGVEVVPTEAREPKLTVADWLQKADQSREQGNAEFRRGSATGATKFYMEALKYLDEVSVDEERALMLRIMVVNNLSAAQLKAGNYKGCVETASMVLLAQPANIKALFRRGTAELNMGDLDKALATLESALALEPGNVAIIRELTECKEQQKKVDKEQQEMVKQKQDKEDKKVCEEKSGWGSWAKWAAGAAGAAIVVGVGYAAFKYLKA